MEKYSCFCCPSKDHSLKNLEDLCPTCGLSYDFPLKYFPTKIAGITIKRALARGFYGATFIGETTPFGNRKVLKAIKIVPVDLYSHHGKDFRNECDEHLQLAENSNHFVKIDQSIFFENTEIEFTNGVKVKCHIIGLEYIDGVTLKEYISTQETIPARAIAQIAIDLIHILDELRKNQKFHNDLHQGNIMIEQLPSSKKRSDAIDENIRAVAIDLGSLHQNTKSNDDSKRIGDLHQVATCLNFLSRKITDNSANYNEKEWRLGFLLGEKADFLKPSIPHQKQITFQNIVSEIEETVYSQTNPWQQELKLKSFDDAVNAQSLRPWYIPSLIVDKNNNWLNRISVREPQVITGMRGCGKTMLLRALEFHARLQSQNEKEKENAKLILDRLKEEGYLGLYVSCVKLLEFNSHVNKDKIEIFEPYSKLFIAYCIQAIYAIRHFKDNYGTEIVRRDYFKGIASTISTLVRNSSELENVTSDYDLEIKLKKYLNSLSDGQNIYTISVHPKIAFPQIAESIRKSSEVLSSFFIHFLLDDLSTRYLDDKNILKLLSALIFQDENCAFKFTTEAQTLEMVIMAPGNTSQAVIGRDYKTFDLGSEVNKIVHERPHEGKEFIEEILSRRARYHAFHPKNYQPSTILGDTTLTSIAEDIVRKEKASSKKGIYYGISALTAVCVGDLGDVITLYEQIIRNSAGVTSYPVKKEIQNQCFLELCHSRLFDLNRRDTRWLDFIESFAEASHHLLLQSAVKKSKGKRERLRQYTAIFIDITVGDKKKQVKQVRELIDAGIFNFQGGPAASRTNRQGNKPQQQFKLIFRKLYGVSKHIGLSSADRFELSGKALADWLENPKKGKKILISNLNPLTEDELNEKIEEKYSPEGLVQNAPVPNSTQLLLFSEQKEQKESLDYSFILNKAPKIKKVKGKIEVDILITGLGFEDATLASAKELIKYNPKKIILIEFDEKGKGKEIREVIKKAGLKKVQVIKLAAIRESKIDLTGNILCDITGLPKSVIFDVVHQSLSVNKHMYFSITEPELLYPLDKDIKKVLSKKDSHDTSHLLNEVAKLLKGESGGYQMINLLPHYTNISDPRVLFSFASAKHERLYNLLDTREYEKINIVVPDGKSPRAELASIAADFALRKYNNATIHKIGEQDIIRTLEQLVKDYYTYFIVNNFPFEIALTGSKYQTVAAAIFCSAFKVSQCWYVKPKKWDVENFSEGSGSTLIYRVENEN